MSAASTLAPPASSAARRVGDGCSRTDRANRAALAILGAALLAAGGAVVLLGNGVITWSEDPASLYRRAAADAVASPNTAAAISAAAGVVAVLAGGLWAALQLRPVTDGPRLGTLRLGDDRRGRTTVAAAAVAKAAGADFASRFGVTSARVTLLALHPRPRAIVTLEIGLDADPAAIVREASAPLARLAGALDAGPVDAELRLRFGRELRNSRGAARVR